MPQVNKQKPGSQKSAAPPPTPLIPTEGDGWGTQTLRLMVYGQSGTGKTTFAATFPAPILWLICSGGNQAGELKSIDTPENRRRITPRAVTTVEALEAFIREGEKYATVVLDHVSGLQDLTLKELLGLDQLPAQKTFGFASREHYGTSTTMCKEVLRSLLSLPGNVVIIGQERVFGGSEEGIASDVVKPTIGVGVTPSLAAWLNPACDYVVQTFKRPRTKVVEAEVNGEKIQMTERVKGIDFCLRTEPHDVYMTKFRIPWGRVLPEAIKDPTYEKLVAVIAGTWKEGT